MTIKAVEMLKTVGPCFCSRVRNNGVSIACDIAKKYIPKQTPISFLLFPMLKDKEQLSGQWMDNYRAIEQVIRQELIVLSSRWVIQAPIARLQ